MEYYIKERNWKQILEFIKGMHSKNEKRLNRSSVVYGEKWLSMETFAENIW